MNIELKNVKYFASGSQETNCFTADIYVNETLVGIADNNGHGGETNIRYIYLKDDEKYKDAIRLFNKAEDFAQSLPDHVWEYEGKKYSRKMNLVILIDELFEKWLKKNEEKKLHAKLNKLSLNAIVVYNEKEGYYRSACKWKNHTIAQLHLSEQGRKSFSDMLKQVTEKLTDGEIIYNKNI